VATHEATVGDRPEEWEEEPSDQQAEEQLSIGRRLGNWKSIASFGLAVTVLALAVLKGGIDPTKLWNQLKTLNIGIFFAAFVVYYLTFPVRGYRWKVLLQNAYRDDASKGAVNDMSIRGLSEILYISWFVNCVVPAKLGDLYRAYLAKLWAHISWTKTVGTVMAERITDILVLSFMLAVTGLIAFHGRLGHISVILIICLALALGGIVALVLMKLLSAQIHRLIPERFRHKYASFEAGTLDSFRRVPLLLGLTAGIWLLEGSRLQLVFLSLGVHTHVLSSVPFAPMLFLALGTAVLTTVPFTPGGLGLVEVVLLSVMVYLGVNSSVAGAVIVVDRILSYWSIAIIGFAVYLVSKRSHFRHPV
jgi:glycosyltransferase 2 family protein